jgi:drug/metabolite transporter (DMT)-like permease
LTSRAAHAVLFAALVAVSTSGPFLVMSRMDAFVVVFWRMAIATLLFLAWSALRGELRARRVYVAQMAAGGLLMATHFVLWVKAFDLTDYASNLVLLVTQPVTAAVVSVRMKEKRVSEVWPSLVLAVIGLAVVAGGDFALGPRALLGDLFCVLGGVAIALFYVVTRDARAHTPLPMFVGVTFGLGAIMVLPFALAARAPLVAWPAASWAWVAALVVVTTVAGHGLMNLAARHVKLFTLNIVIVLEPAIAIAMGAAMFGASVKIATVIGGVFLVAAVVFGLRERAAQNSRSRMA